MEKKVAKLYIEYIPIFLKINVNLFNKYILSTYDVLGSVLDSGDSSRSHNKNPCPHGAYILLDGGRE